MTELSAVIEKMFEAARVPPETFYRSCDGLLQLSKTTDPVLFRQACQTALQYGVYKYNFIKQLVKSKCEGLEETNLQNKPLMPPSHKNLRGKEQFK